MSNIEEKTLNTVNVRLKEIKDDSLPTGYFKNVVSFIEYRHCVIVHFHLNTEINEHHTYRYSLNKIIGHGAVYVRHQRTS